MQVKLNFENHVALVTREPGDPIFKNGGYAGNRAAESRFFYHIRNVLRGQGFDVIKKNMGKDGHLVDDLQPYVRTREMPLDGVPGQSRFMVWFTAYALRDAVEIFQEKGEVYLTLEW